MKPKIKIAIGIFTLITAMLSGFSFASAQDANTETTPATAVTAPPPAIPAPPLSNAREGFSLAPANGPTDAHDFSFELKAGESVTGNAFIKNFSSDPVRFYLYGSDPTVSNTGSPAYETRAQSLEGPGSWIRFSEPEIDLAPDEERIVAFAVTAPGNAASGEYRAGVTMEKTQIANNNPGITIATRVVNRANINVLPAPAENTTATQITAPTAAPTPSWQIYYFWISFALFLASLALLIWSILARGNKGFKKHESHQPHGHTPHAKKKRGGR